MTFWIHDLKIHDFQETVYNHHTSILAISHIRIRIENQLFLPSTDPLTTICTYRCWYFNRSHQHSVNKDVFADYVALWFYHKFYYLSNRLICLSYHWTEASSISTRVLEEFLKLCLFTKCWWAVLKCELWYGLPARLEAVKSSTELKTGTIFTT